MADIDQMRLIGSSLDAFCHPVEAYLWQKAGVRETDGSGQSGRVDFWLWGGW